MAPRRRHSTGCASRPRASGSSEAVVLSWCVSARSPAHRPDGDRRPRVGRGREPQRRCRPGTRVWPPPDRRRSRRLAPAGGRRRRAAPWRPPKTCLPGTPNRASAPAHQRTPGAPHTSKFLSGDDAPKINDSNHVQARKADDGREGARRSLRSLPPRRRSSRRHAITLRARPPGRDCPSLRRPGSRRRSR